VRAFWHLDSAVVLSRDIAPEALYPALDPLASWSKALDPAVVGDRHYAAVREARRVLGRWQELRDVISMLGMECCRPRTASSSDARAGCRPTAPGRRSNIVQSDRTSSPRDRLDGGLKGE
jgi:hypothetical protein